MCLRRYQGNVRLPSLCGAALRAEALPLRWRLLAGAPDSAVRCGRRRERARLRRDASEPGAWAPGSLVDHVCSVVASTSALTAFAPPLVHVVPGAVHEGVSDRALNL